MSTNSNEFPYDILNKKFGQLTVVEYLGQDDTLKSRPHRYDTVCDCGAHKVCGRQTLMNGDTQSCGCKRSQNAARRLESMVGQTFNRWTVLRYVGERVSKSGKSKSYMYECQCVCGKIKLVHGSHLRRGVNQSCGCLQKEVVSKAATDDLTGRRYEYLTVIERAPNIETSASVRWRCRCDCGNIIETFGFSLKNRDCTSCGCRKISLMESYVIQYLESIAVEYVQEKTFPGLVGSRGGSLRFDVYFEMDNVKYCVECQGSQHFEAVEHWGGAEYLKRLQEHDEIKRLFCAENGIFLIEISYNEFTDQDTFVEVLKSKMNTNPHG